MSQQASSADGPYSPNRSGVPSAWTPPGYVPAAGGPGWTARILFWAALVIGSLPEFVMMPMMIGGAGPEFFTRYSTLMILVVILELVLGLVALLIVKASPMKLRLFGMGLLLFISIYALGVRYLMPIIVTGVIGSFTLAMNIQSIIWTFHGGVMLAGTLIAWNLARNRVWWTNLIAAGYALLMGLVVAFVEWALNVLGSSFATSMVLTQLLALAAALGGLGLLHVVGDLANMGIERRRGRAPATEP
ncbi:hypothetical protein [Brevibacterium sandarakinum]|uniref:hypothetical protein n=1 Tax=Brevibacterium sandarakinum TaxID=629680 RepID=UPI00264F521E|nr:hypothetical protein [Brevibacterium sandarakinum]MDN5658275.1 hypothetical protein [Brevibacterium sandarakinum]